MTECENEAPQAPSRDNDSGPLPPTRGKAMGWLGAPDLERQVLYGRTILECLGLASVAVGIRETAKQFEGFGEGGVGHPLGTLRDAVLRGIGLFVSGRGAWVGFAGGMTACRSCVSKDHGPFTSIGCSMRGH